MSARTREPRTRDVGGGITFVELIRLAVVVLATAGALEIAQRLDMEGTALLTASALGAGLGYVIGGISGRFTLGRINRAEQRLQSVSASEIVAGGAGMLIGMLLASGVTWPVLLFGGKVFTVPFAAIIIIVTAWTGLRLGRSRASDMLRYLGTGGRLPQGSRASGDGYKLVDSSILIDGRITAVARDGFIEGVLLVPEFVLYELQGLADSAESERRKRGQRGLETVSALQRLSHVALEVLSADPQPAEVDAKLLALAKERSTPLLTTDHNLARIAEVQGVKVLNVNALADSLRPPVTPGDRLSLRITKEGRETHQGVGFLPDGTMVVVERTADAVGEMVEAEVTSIMNNAHGRLVFASRADRPRLVSDVGDDTGF